MSQIQHTPTPELGKYDFDGACAPHSGGYYAKKKGGTFSLGIFQWIPKASGKGLKRGTVIERVLGDCARPDAAYEEARRLCGEYTCATHAKLLPPYSSPHPASGNC